MSMFEAAQLLVLSLLVLATVIVLLQAAALPAAVRRSAGYWGVVLTLLVVLVAQLWAMSELLRRATAEPGEREAPQPSVICPPAQS